MFCKITFTGQAPVSTAVWNYSSPGTGFFTYLGRNAWSSCQPISPACQDPSGWQCNSLSLTSMANLPPDHFSNLRFLTSTFLCSTLSRFLPEGKLSVAKGVLEIKILQGPIRPLTPSNICVVTQYIKCTIKVIMFEIGFISSVNKTFETKPELFETGWNLWRVVQQYRNTVYCRRWNLDISGPVYFIALLEFAHGVSDENRYTSPFLFSMSLLHGALLLLQFNVVAPSWQSQVILHCAKQT